MLNAFFHPRAALLLAVPFAWLPIQGQNPCTTGNCSCVASLNSSSNPAGTSLLDGLPHSTSNGQGFLGDISFALTPKLNANGDDDSLHDGTCQHSIGPCDCDPMGCNYTFSLSIEISDFAGKTVPQGETLHWGLGDPSTGKVTRGDFPQDTSSGTWGSVISTGWLNRQLSCGNPDSPMLLVIGTDTEMWASVEIHLHCLDCPNTASTEQP